MTDKKNRLILVIVIFLVFAIPVIFLNIKINRELIFTEYRLKEDLREELLDEASKLEENLEPFNYLKSELNKIHSKIFTEAPSEIIEKIPDNDFIKNLYTEETFNKIVNQTKERFAPIIITFGTNNISNIYAYYSPELKQSIINNEEKELLYSKSFFDLHNLKEIYFNYFNTLINLPNPNIDGINNKNKQKREYYLDFCYKYISRFSAYNRNTPLYTDYFNKQVLYPILKYTMSQKGIHGFYTLLIPESHIVPKSILTSALQKNKSEVKIELVKNKADIGNEGNNLIHVLNFPSSFINQVNSYKKLNGIDQSYILQNQLVLSINYPKSFLIIRQLNKYTNFFIVIISLLYLVFSLTIAQKSLLFNLKLSQKLILVLCIIIMLPTIGIGILYFVFSRNINNLIELNVRKNLHNHLENYSLIDQENFARRLSSVLDLKQRINSLYYKNKADFIAKNQQNSSNDAKIWKESYRNYFSDLYILSANKDLYHFNKSGLNLSKKVKSSELIEIVLLKYLKNLNIIRKKIKNDETFKFFLVDEYIDSKVEERIIAQESIPTRDLISLKELDCSSFFYTKDANNNNYICYYKSSGKNNRPYYFLSNYLKKKPLWYKPHINNSSNTDLAITLRNTSDEERIQFPANSIYKKDFKMLINKILEKKDNGNEKIKNTDSIIFKEWTYNNYSPFVAIGITEISNNNTLSFITSMIFPMILTYGILLLILLSNFIAFFINKPISIYQEAIEKLQNNMFGTTISSFSKDEFNYITDAFNEMSIAIKQKEQIKRYVSDKLIQFVEKNDIQKAGDGKQEKVSILSSDIRNFTGTSEKYEPSIIVEMLNSYFTKMQKAISDNGGIIDKYIGDAIQAVFYNEPDKENQVIRAAKAALAMRTALTEFNKERESNGLFTIENGIGIDTDFAITGTIGTAKGRKDFSVNGDVISRAAELEAKTKKTTSKILISKKSLEELNSHNTTYLIKTDSITELFYTNENFQPIQKSQLVLKAFDDESVELIDVRK